jgi:hypothetical protein
MEENRQRENEEERQYVAADKDFSEDIGLKGVESDRSSDL